MEYPSRVFIPWVLAGLATAGFLPARTFTDTSGKTIEADFVSRDGENVVLKMNGRDYRLPISRFSEADQVYLREQPEGAAAAEEPAAGGAGPGAEPAKPAAPMPKTAGAGKVMFRDTEIKPNAVVALEIPLDEETLKKAKKADEDIKALKITVAVPPGFDPSKPQKYLLISAAINNDAERAGGNARALRGYQSTALAAGWAVLAVDCDLGNPIRAKGSVNEELHTKAFEELGKEWGGFKQSDFACAGFSGGAKGTFAKTGYLLASQLRVIGLFLGGCNRSYHEEAEQRGVSSAAKRRVNVFVSNGTKDTIAPVDSGKKVAKDVRRPFGKVRFEEYDSGHSLSTIQLKLALEWFVAEKKADAE